MSIANIIVYMFFSVRRKKILTRLRYTVLRVNPGWPIPGKEIIYFSRREPLKFSDKSKAAFNRRWPFVSNRPIGRERAPQLAVC